MISFFHSTKTLMHNLSVSIDRDILSFMINRCVTNTVQNGYFNLFYLFLKCSPFSTPDSIHHSKCLKHFSTVVWMKTNVVIMRHVQKIKLHFTKIEKCTFVNETYMKYYTRIPLILNVISIQFHAFGDWLGVSQPIWSLTRVKRKSLGDRSGLWTGRSRTSQPKQLKLNVLCGSWVLSSDRYIQFVSCPLLLF